MKTIFISTLLLLNVLEIAIGEDAQRTWTDESKTYETKASLVDITSSVKSVFLRLESGNVKEIPFDKLSETDQKYVRDQIKLKSNNGDKSKQDRSQNRENKNSYGDDQFRAELLKIWTWGTPDQIARIKNAVIGAKAIANGLRLNSVAKPRIKEDTRWLLEKIGPNKSSLLNGKSGNDILRDWAKKNSQNILRNSGKTNFIFPDEFELRPDADLKWDLLIRLTWGNQQEHLMALMAIIGARAIAAGAPLSDLKVPGQKQAVKDLLETFGDNETTLFFGKTGNEVLGISTKRELLEVLQADIDPNTGNTVYNTPFGKIPKQVLEEELERLFPTSE